VSEIKILLPIIAQAAVIMTEKLGNVQFIISKHPGRPASMYEEALKGCSFDYRFAEGDLHNIVASSDFAIVASGTATLETAMLGTPLIIVYKTNPLTYVLYKIVTTIPFLGIVNVIADKEVAPELLQANMTREKVAGKTIALLLDPAALAAMRRELAAVKATLGSPGASMRAARAIIPLIS
jgi:lipid-A-disaccharide synthase